MIKILKMVLAIGMVSISMQVSAQIVVPQPSDGGGKGVDIHKVYDVVEKMPTLPNGGGQQAIASLLQQTVLIPQGEKAEGQVIVQFIVDRKGKPDKVKIIKAPTPALGKAVESAVRKLPHLTPGMQNGETANVQLQMVVALAAKQ